MSTSPQPGHAGVPTGSRTRLRDRRAIRAAARASLPEASRPPGWGRRLLGALVGLVTTPVAVVLTGVGAARLAESAPSRGGGDTLGIALLVLGVLVLAAVAVLGSWSSAAPVVGGLVWGVVVGAAAVVSPRRFSEVVEELGAAGAPAATEQLVRSATGGLLLVVGTLLLATGTATAIARRVGRRTTLDAAEAEAEATAAPAGGRTDARGTGT